MPNPSSKNWRLAKLLDGFADVSPQDDVVVTGLCISSRDLKPGEAFVALAGYRSHGLDYAQQAESSGASAIIWDPEECDDQTRMLAEMPRAIPVVAVKKLRVQLAELALRCFGDSSAEMFVVGVTGTDGKTSVSNFIAQALHRPPCCCGLMGTLGNGFPGALENATHTTADVISIHRGLAQMLHEGARQVVMEASSHGLHQGRLKGVRFDVAVLTNLGRDHLDYHGDIEIYRNEKRRLFQWPDLRHIVVNIDDDFGRELAGQYRGCLPVWGYSTAAARPAVEVDFLLWAKSIEPRPQGSQIEVVTPHGEGEFLLPVLGRFNVSNALAALAVLLIAGLSLSESLQRLQELNTVTGRMEVFRAQGKPAVVVDYAHTPQALQAVLKSLRDHCQGELWCVFGCGGDRDRGKRPQMAEVAELEADHVIVTDDNPRHENPAHIVHDIMQGFKAPDRVRVIGERGMAIAQAITGAAANDFVLVAGKGHEDYQLRGDQRLAYNERDVVRQLLAEVVA